MIGKLLSGDPAPRQSARQNTHPCCADHPGQRVRADRPDDCACPVAPAAPMTAAPLTDTPVPPTPTPAGRPPAIANLPAQSVSDGSVFPHLRLSNYVSDPDDDPRRLTWSVSGNVELNAIILGEDLVVILPNSRWTGSETLLLQACDSAGLCDTATVVYTVRAENDRRPSRCPTNTSGWEKPFPRWPWTPVCGTRTMKATR